MKRNTKRYTDEGHLYIKCYNPYINGTCGADIELTLKERIQILFSKGISVVFIGKRAEEEMGCGE